MSSDIKYLPANATHYKYSRLCVIFPNPQLITLVTGIHGNSHKKMTICGSEISSEHLGN